MRVYTLDNMHEVKLQQRFNEHSLNIWTRFLLQSYRRITQQKKYITLGDVYTLFEQGHKFDEIKKILKSPHEPIDAVEISNNTILNGQIFYHAANPGIKGFNREGVPKALVDENLGEYNAIDGAQRVFGYATHTVFEGLNGQCDTRVWERGQDFDFIISKDMAVKSNRVAYEDRDLTNCSYDTWRKTLQKNGGVIDDEIRALPIIIHIVNADADGRTVKKLLQKHKAEILRLAQEKKSPIILLEKGRKPKIGKHYLELINGDIAEKRQTLIDKRFSELFEMDPFILGQRTLAEYSSTIRELIENDVDTILSEHRNIEVLMPMLDDYIERVRTVGVLTNNALSNLFRQIENDRPVKQFGQMQNDRRIKKGYKPSGLYLAA